MGLTILFHIMGNVLEAMIMYNYRIDAVFRSILLRIKNKRVAKELINLKIYKNNLIVFVFSLLVFAAFLYLGTFDYPQEINVILQLLLNVIFILNVFIIIPLTIGNIIHLIIRAFKLKRILLIPILLVILSIAFVIIWAYVMAQVGMGV